MALQTLGRLVDPAVLGAGEVSASFGGEEVLSIDEYGGATGEIRVVTGAELDRLDLGRKLFFLDRPFEDVQGFIEPRTALEVEKLYLQDAYFESVAVFSF